MLADDTLLVPDVAFIESSRIPKGDFVFYPIAPDLAVEVISASETNPKIRQKTRRYLEAGTQIVWNVYPEDQTVDVVTQGEVGTLFTKTLSADDDIDGGTVLPGFKAKVAEFFL